MIRMQRFLRAVKVSVLPKEGMTMTQRFNVGLVLLLCVMSRALSQTTQPFVAIHDSELTRALENMNAIAPTPTGPGTTGKQWWPTDWHYFVMPESVKEALKSDGTAFEAVGDSDVAAGALLANGQP